jgi:uncharacterized linocin/CFP29 family protein
MSYLSRESSPLPAELWQQIDAAVVETARGTLSGRRFLHLGGPLGIGASVVPIDDATTVGEVVKDGIITTQGRRYVELPLLYEDATLLARDLETAAASGLVPDLAAIRSAARAVARKEDRLIFIGNPDRGYEGLVTAQGVNTIERKDWSAGENAFADVAYGIEVLLEKGIAGEEVLVLSPDLALQLQRLQPGTGLLERDRVAELVGGHVVVSPALGTGKAVLVCAESENMELVVGQDMTTAFLEQSGLNSSLRVLETILLRIKHREAVVVLA